ncbi:hypothetical protein DPMN_167929, partial [Dreissena polymorpha]
MLKALAILTLLGAALAAEEQLLSEKILSQLNQQISYELRASYFYQAYSHYFGRSDVALPGFAKWFEEASKEERSHATSLMEYINKRGGDVTLNTLQEHCTQENLELVWARGYVPLNPMELGGTGVYHLQYSAGGRDVGYITFNTLQMGGTWGISPSIICRWVRRGWDVGYITFNTLQVVETWGISSSILCRCVGRVVYHLQYSAGGRDVGFITVNTLQVGGTWGISPSIFCMWVGREVYHLQYSAGGWDVGYITVNTLQVVELLCRGWDAGFTLNTVEMGVNARDFNLNTLQAVWAGR